MIKKLLESLKALIIELAYNAGAYLERYPYEEYGEKNKNEKC